MRTHLGWISLLGGLAIVLGVGCSEPPPGDAPANPAAVLSVAVSVPPLADLVTAVGDERVRVTVAMPPGADPHTFEPTPSLMAGLEGADLAVVVGSGAFPWERTLLDRPARPVLALVEKAGPAVEPHAWLDLDAVAALAPRLAAALGSADPAGDAGYRRRAADFAAALEQTRTAIGKRLDPLAGRVYFVDHPAWSRLTTPHGLSERALEAGHREATAATLAARIEEARETGARALFVRPGPPTPAARTFLEATGVNAVPLDPLAVPWRENLLAAASAIAESLDAR